MQSDRPAASRSVREAGERKPESRSVVVAIAVLELTVLAVWGGGLVALGAIAAPTVFGIVPAPSSADAMTVVFRRFDRVAITCAAIALACEVAAVLKARVRTPDLVRGAAAVLAAGLAIVEGAWLSPAIEALHRQGAIRGLGDAGLALERTHRLAETAGKGQLLLLFVTLVLVVERLSRFPGHTRC